jgi:hypothetical protein
MFAHTHNRFSSQHRNGLDYSESVRTKKSVEKSGLGEPTLHSTPVFRFSPVATTFYDSRQENSFFFFLSFWRNNPAVGQGLLIHEVCRSLI